MDLANVSHLTAQAIYLALLLSAPALLAGLIAGMVAGVFQTATQLHDASLSHVPKLLAVAAALAISSGWMGSSLLRFTAGLWESIPRLVQ